MKVPLNKGKIRKIGLETLAEEAVTLEDVADQVSLRSRRQDPIQCETQIRTQYPEQRGQRPNPVEITFLSNP